MCDHQEDEAKNQFEVATVNDDILTRDNDNKKAIISLYEDPEIGALLLRNFQARFVK